MPDCLCVLDGRHDWIVKNGDGAMLDLKDFLRSPDDQSIAEDEASMTDPTGSEWWTAIDMVLVNRIAPEIVTHLDT